MLSSAIRSMTIPIASLTAALSAVPAVVPASIAAAQGMVIPRAGLCVAPMVCSTGCPAPNCIPVIGPAVARTSSQVEATLADRVIHYEVTETFINRGPRLAEADYVFPLPAGAAFQDLQLSINGELVAGEALNANDARGVYEEIVRRLRDPALVEWMGTGMLRARIFPIAPGEVKKVVVRFQTVAPREGDAIRIDYAGAGAPDPRATGGTPVGYLLDQTAIRRAGSGGRGGGADDGSDRTSGSYFTLTYRAADGFGTPYSPTHALTAAHDGDRQSVRIDGSARDITILLPITHTSSAAVTMLPYATGDGPGFALITVAPPAVHVAPTPRDLTFVLDVSGSMSGRKLEQARAAGRQMLGTLTSRDRFRLIDFSTDVRTFRDRFETATPDHIREAEQYLDQLEAEGSTNIEAALRAALTVPAEDDGTPSDASRLPLTLFITDGEPTIGQRDAPALVAQAVSVLGRTRLFTFGLGVAGARDRPIRPSRRVGRARGVARRQSPHQSGDHRRRRRCGRGAADADPARSPGRSLRRSGSGVARAVPGERSDEAPLYGTHGERARVLGFDRDVSGARAGKSVRGEAVGHAADRIPRSRASPRGRDARAGRRAGELG
jgi:Ca-activated chloride channel family protein